MRSAVMRLIAGVRGRHTQSPHDALQPPPQPPARLENDAPAPGTARRAGGALLEFAVFSCLLAGAVGILRATQMDRPADILVCLIGSVTGCSLVSYLYFRRE